jgi:hypothetical protein
MKYMKNDKAISDQDVPESSDRRILILHRALILGMVALLCLMTFFGLIVLPLSGLVEDWIPFPGIFAFILVMSLFRFYLLKDNPRLKKASLWSFRSYRMLDERENLVVDHAFRTSYAILALACYFLVFCIFINVNYLHLPFHLGLSAFIYINYGAVLLMLYLPAIVVAWHESV